MGKTHILVTGATGFIGRSLAPFLFQEGYKVRCLVRDAARARRLFGSSVELAEGSILDLRALKAAASGIQSVIHMAALKTDEPDIQKVNVQGARNLVEACRQAGTTRFINISTQATRMPRRGAYGETKAQADAIVMASGLEVTTLVPSLVYGPQDPGVFGKLARFVVSYPIVPIIGDGTARYRPIHVDDLCRLIEGCLRREGTIGKTYNVGSLETVTLEELVDLIAAAKGLRRMKFHIPAWMALSLAGILSRLFYKPPLSLSNVLGALQSTVDGDFDSICGDIGFTPRSLDEGLRDSL